MKKKPHAALRTLKGLGFLKTLKFVCTMRAPPRHCILETLDPLKYPSPHSERHCVLFYQFAALFRLHSKPTVSPLTNVFKRADAPVHLLDHLLDGIMRFFQYRISLNKLPSAFLKCWRFFY